VSRTAAMAMSRLLASATRLFNSWTPRLFDLLLCFHRHSGLGRAFSAPTLCFHRHSRVVRAEKEFSLRSEVPGGQRARRGVTGYNGRQGPAQRPFSQFARAHLHPTYRRPGHRALHPSPNYWTRHHPPNRLLPPPLFRAFPYATSLANWRKFVKREMWALIRR
jgi:hypothetical protein